MRLSFIIIGRNEGWKLSKCFDSVFESILFNNLKDSEVIYIDSQSTDNSVKIAQSYQKIKIFLITGELNAAIARNIGAKEATGDILFFIDGDMELDKKFLSYAIVDNDLKYENLTGHIDDYLYDHNNNFLGIKNRTYNQIIPKKEQIIKTNGGIFLIKKSVWDFLNGMNTKYKRSQDIDFSIRLSKIGLSIFVLPYMICKHHTIEYSNDRRMWQNLNDKYYAYHALILREHFSSVFILKRFFRFNYTEFILLCVFLSLISIKFFFPYISILYIIILSLRSLSYTFKTKLLQNRFKYFCARFGYQMLHDILFWYGFFFFWPHKEEMKYIKL